MLYTDHYNRVWSLSGGILCYHSNDVAMYINVQCIYCLFQNQVSSLIPMSNLFDLVLVSAVYFWVVLLCSLYI